MGSTLTSPSPASSATLLTDSYKPNINEFTEWSFHSRMPKFNACSGISRISSFFHEHLFHTWWLGLEFTSEVFFASLWNNELPLDNLYQYQFPPDINILYSKCQAWAEAGEGGFPDPNFFWELVELDVLTHRR